MKDLSKAVKRVILGKQYICRDYEGNVMPGTFVPFERLNRGHVYLTYGPEGGHITMFRNEFLRLAK